MSVQKGRHHRLAPNRVEEVPEVSTSPTTVPAYLKPYPPAGNKGEGFLPFEPAAMSQGGWVSSRRSSGHRATFDVMDEDKIRELSCHEAGHPVAHHLLGSEFQFVCLERDSAGWQTYPADTGQAPMDAQERETQMVVALAGDLAGALFGYTTASPFCAERAERLVAHLDWYEADAYVATMKRKTRKLLNTPQRRGAIGALGDHLFRQAPRPEDHRPRCRIPSTEIVAIIDEALNRGPA